MSVASFFGHKEKLHLSPLQAADFAQLLLESGNDRLRDDYKRSWKTEILKYCMCWVNPPPTQDAIVTIRINP